MPPDSCEALLARMISFTTVNPAFGGPVEGAATLAVYLESVARTWDLATRRYEVKDGAFNLLISTEISPDAEWLLFESHLDTVGIDGMTVPPFEMTVTGNRLYGRGACDTKASGAAMLWSLKEYARRPERTHNAGVVFVVDEEAGMSGAQAFATSEIIKNRKLRGVVVGEPTKLRPVVAHNGVMRWKTITRGLAAHSADPSRGSSAIRVMVRVVEALETKFIPLAHRESPLTGRAAASINLIRGGSAVNVVPDYCEILCDRRLVPGETPDEVLAEREAALADITVEHEPAYFVPPLISESSAKLHQWIAPAFASCGLAHAATGASYVTDASHYAAAGAQVIVLGPGDIAQAHTCDEWIDRNELARAVTLYGAILQLPT